MTSKPTIVDMLYMPEAADIDIDFEKVDIQILDEKKLEELMKVLSENTPESGHHDL